MSTSRVLQQGLIIEGLRTPETNGKCYGVVITARCDIAQVKVKKIHYLSMYSFNEWMINVYFVVIFNEEKKSIYKKVNEWLIKNELIPDLVEKFKLEEAIEVVSKYAKKQEEKDIIEKIQLYYEMKSINTDSLSRKDRVDFLNGKLVNIKDNKVKLLLNDQLGGWYFLPQNEVNNPTEDCGYVVDLRSINELDFGLANRIVDGEIDCKYNPRLLENQELCSALYLCGVDDYVFHCGVLKSPRLEHLMQTFSLTFIRIGLDGLTDKEKEDIRKMKVIE